MKESTKEKLKKRRLRPFLRKNLRFTVICLMISAVFFALSFNYRPLTEEDYEIHAGTIENVQTEHMSFGKGSSRWYSLFQINGKDFCYKGRSKDGRETCELIEGLEGRIVTVYTHSDLISIIRSPGYSNMLQVEGLYDEKNTYVSFEYYSAYFASLKKFYIILALVVLLVGGVVLWRRWRREIDPRGGFFGRLERAKKDSLDKMDLIHLHQNFQEMRVAHGSDEEKKIFKEKTDDLIFLRRKVERQGDAASKALFCYCIDTMDEVLREGDRIKLAAYLETVCTLLYSYGSGEKSERMRSIRSFRRVYGQHWFAPVEQLKVKFYGYLPKHYKNYFVAGSAKLMERIEGLKMSKPALFYTLAGLAAVGIAVPPLSMVLVLYVVSDKAPPDALLQVVIGVLVMVGSVFVSIGWVSSTFVYRYAGRKLKAWLPLIGLLMSAVPLLYLLLL